MGKGYRAVTFQLISLTFSHISNVWRHAVWPSSLVFPFLLFLPCCTAYLILRMIVCCYRLYFLVNPHIFRTCGYPASTMLSRFARTSASLDDCFYFSSSKNSKNMSASIYQLFSVDFVNRIWISFAVVLITLKF